MRRSDWLVGIVALMAGALGAGAMACVFSADFNSCEQYPHEGCPGLTTTTSTSGTGGMGGDGGGPKIDCSGDPTPLNGDTGNIRDECAIFVRSDATGASPDGTMDNPLAKLSDAFAKAVKDGKKKVFACAPAMKPFTETVSLDSGLEVYGGFDCSAKTWTWAETGRAEVDGQPDLPAWTITAAAKNAVVSGFTIKAAKPSDMKGGGDSIGVAADDVAAEIERCDISAADAAAGKDGTPPSAAATDGANATENSGMNVVSSNACAADNQVFGGPGATMMCGNVDVGGGAGGPGGIVNMNTGNGTSGSPGMPTSASTGVGGTGESSSPCSQGVNGKNGDPGSAGPGGKDIGKLTLKGVVTSEVTDGTPGTPGQGGGGGGGAKAGMFCPGPNSTIVNGNGPSGGGGGAGGCGGQGGHGGTAGGSSIAILSLGTSLKIDGMTVTVTAGLGGKGGAGAVGQGGGGAGSGAKGGTKAAAGSSNGCKGGDGGNGGNGGPGGGGRGGHSIGIAYAKAPATPPTLKTPPAFGTAGDGGMPGAPGNTGAKGAAGAICDFSKTSSPCM